MIMMTKNGWSAAAESGQTMMQKIERNDDDDDEYTWN